MNNNTFIYSKPTEEQASDICALVAKVFDEFIAPVYDQQGIKEFYDYLNVENIIARLDNPNYFAIICSYENKLIGLIEIRQLNHVSLLFVDANYQAQGVAGKLFAKAIEICKYMDPSLEKITVNASPNSVIIYQKLGFKVTDNEQKINSTCLVPMSLRINNKY